MQPLQTRLSLLFSASEKDVTADIMPDLLGFSYTDKETNEADELTLTLKDEKGKWASSWKPEGGEVIRASVYSGNTLYAQRKLNCGRFYVDTISTSGPPRVVEIRAVSIPLNKPIRKRIKNKAWEKNTLKGIAQAIAKDNSMGFMYDAQENPSFDRQDQQNESDLKFLGRLCDDAGLSIKVTDDKVVIFDQASYEKKKPIKSFTLGVDNILSWVFEQAQSDTYKSVTVSYRDPKKKKKTSAGGYEFDSEGTLVRSSKKTTNPAVMTYTYTDPDASEEGQEYKLKKRAKSIDEAKRLARAKLRQLNLKSVTGSLTIIGDTSMVAGVVISVKGFGSFDGNFYVQEASHSVSTSGYTTELTLRKVNNKYQRCKDGILQRRKHERSS